MKHRLHEFLLRLRALFVRRRLEREMADELAFHQAMLQDKLMRQGASPDEAQRSARLRFGDRRRWHERLRELWQFRWLENMRRDVSYSIRVLRRSPGFTAVAILTLALGVGANTTVFSIVNGLLLRPLPVPESDRLVILEMLRGFPDPVEGFSEPMFRALENRHNSFAEVFATFHTEAEIRGQNGTEPARAELVSGDFFAGLRTPPLLGRILTRADDQKGGNPNGFAIVISEGFWQRWFNREPNVIGQKLHLDNVLFTVVGVMPKRFIGEDPLQRPEIFVPLAAEPAMDGERNLTTAGVNAWWMNIMARLQPGVTMEQANAQLAAESGPYLRQLNANEAWISQREKEHFRLQAESGSTGYTFIRLIFRKPLMAVFAMCGGVLLLACLNLASLLMARGAARQKELATRLSMGATRGRLVQQLLTESLLISAAGTVLGLGLAPWVGQSLSALLFAGQFETNLDTNLDIRVFAFAAAVSIIATIIVGFVPALQATSSGLNEQMKQGQHTTQAHERHRVLPKIMMAFEVALALMLVVGAGLLTSSLVKLYRSGAGFDPRGLHSIAISMDHQPLHGGALIQFYRQVGEELKRQSGVKSVSWQLVVPLSHMTWDQNFYVQGGKEEDIHENAVAPEYFKSMRIPLLSGRDFRWDDRAASGKKVIINKTAAKLLFGDRDAVGRTINNKNENKVIPYEVIGVASDAKYEDVRSGAPPTLYHPMTQENEDQPPSFNAVVRVEGSPSGLAATARSIVQKINPEIPAPKISSMENMVDESLSAERTMALISGFFALCALMVTAIGLYGTLAYATARRTTEIGIRMALGAKRTQVARMVFAQNSAVALAGTAGGLGCALIGSKLLASFLYGTSERDPWIFAGSILMLALIASAASLLPALRAARIEPMRAIRCE